MKLTDITNFVGITKLHKPVEPEQDGVDREDLGPKKILLSWVGKPDFNFTKIDPRYKRTFIVIGVVMGLLLIAMQEFFFIIVLASFAFLYQVMVKNVEVDEFKYEVNTHGLGINDNFYYWDELEKFYFTNTVSGEQLIVDLKAGLPGRLIITYRPEDKEKIIDVFNTYIRYLEEAPRTVFDKAYDKVVDKFDFEQKK